MKIAGIPLLRKLRWRDKLIVMVLFSVFIAGSGAMLAVYKIRGDMFREYRLELLKPLESLIDAQIRHDMRNHSARHCQSLLADIKVSEEIRHIRVLDGNQVIKFSNDNTELGQLIDNREMIDAGIPVSDHRIFRLPAESSADIRMLTSIVNEPDCHACHEAVQTHLGYLAIDLTNAVGAGTQATFLKLDFAVYSLFLILITLVISLLHQQVFQKPLYRIQAGIARIEAGDLSTRIDLRTRGELSRLAGAINNMTAKLEQNRSEIDELHHRQINRAGQLASIGELAASVAHEIKNPVSGIRNALEIFKGRQNHIFNEQWEVIVAEMVSQADRVLKTVQDLMDFAKPSKPHFRALDLEQTLDQIISLHRQQIASDGIELRENFLTGGLTIEGDPEQLKQVFVNLLLNAYQATSGTRNPRIDIGTEFDSVADIVRISFKNTGSWIPTENRQQIFKPFFTTKHKGTGLGLSLSLAIVESHGGRILVDSNDWKWSTCFTVELPIRPLKEN
ncbi:MAG: ATP-binding protein [Candidatus Neomarinimicrobiota bacterium]